MMKKNENKIENDTLGAIGIGAMIVFIALVLVAAVASAVIIQTGEKLQQNAQQTGSDTQREISGKISINTVIIHTDDDYMLLFESSPGSDVIQTNQINWQMTCDDGAYNYLSDDFLGAFDGDDHATMTAVTEIMPGESYGLVLDAVPAVASDCSAGNLGVNGEVTFWIHVNGGGSTYERLYISDATAGSLVI